MQMVGKEYAEYACDLRTQYNRFINFYDTTKSHELIRQIEEVAQKTGCIKWKLLVEYFEYDLCGQWPKLFGIDRSPAVGTLEKLLNLLEKAERANIVPLELLFRHRVIVDHYWHSPLNYELAFELYIIQAEQLKNVSVKDIPEKTEYYMNIAKAYHFFRDYTQAMIYYKKILEEERNVCFSVSPRLHARNGLGLIYRAANDFERSNSYFLAILESDDIRQHGYGFENIWIAIAEGSLGHNYFLLGEYDKAIPLLKSSIDRSLADRDYAHLSGVLATLAQLYISKGNAAEAKRYVDLARKYHDIAPRGRTLLQIYEVLSRYYAITGNARLAIAYMDSVSMENRRLDDQFSALQLLRANQRHHLLEQRLKEEQLKAETIRSSGYRRSLVIAITALLLIGGILIRYFLLYRKKRAAYQKLVSKSQAWAQVYTEIAEPDDTIELDDATDFDEEEYSNLPDDIDLSIMKDIEKLMQTDKLYKDYTFSLDSLAQKLGTKQHYVSVAINHCTRKNFNTFVNEYRIKEAVQILSKNDARIPTMEAIAFDVGFSSRQIFHRTFKKLTGLSPAEFRRNVG